MESQTHLVVFCLTKILCLASTLGVMNDLKGFGMNLAEVIYYSKGTPFKNRFLSAQPFFSGTEWTWSDNRELNLDENGYPRSLESGQYAKSLFLQVGNYDDAEVTGTTYSYMNIGPHVFTFDGDCTGCCNFRFNGEILNSSNDGEWIINITSSSTRPMIQIECIPDEDNYPRNFAIIPQEWSYSNDDDDGDDDSSKENNNVWDPNWIESLNKTNFKVLRFMDWQRTNNNPITEWSNRTLSTEYTQGSDYGVALEYIIDLIFYLNDIQSERYVIPWICIPHGASDDYISQLARFIKENYFDMLDNYGFNDKIYSTDDEKNNDNNYKIIIEYSNECWNGQFDCYSYMMNEYTNGDEDYALNSADDNIGNVYQWYSKRVCDIRQIFDRMLGNDYSNQVYIVLGTQIVNSWITDQALQFEYKYYDSNNNWAVTSMLASECVNGVAGAPYFCMYDMTDEEIASSTNDECFDNLLSDNARNYELTSILDQIDVISNYYGYDKENKLKLITYEGGWHCVPSWNDYRDSLTTKYYEMNADTRITDVLYAYYYDFHDATNFSSLFTFFNHIGWGGQWGNWGHLRFQKDYSNYDSSDGVYKWQAIDKLEKDLSSLLFGTGDGDRDTDEDETTSTTTPCTCGTSSKSGSIGKSGSDDVGTDSNDDLLSSSEWTVVSVCTGIGGFICGIGVMMLKNRFCSKESCVGDQNKDTNYVQMT